MPKVFISYRRDDSPKDTGRIYDRLRTELPKGDVFRDLDSIGLGADFPTMLDKALSGCDLVLVIIGPRYLTVTDESGRRRLDSPEDLPSKRHNGQLSSVGRLKAIEGLRETAARVMLQSCAPGEKPYFLVFSAWRWVSREWDALPAREIATGRALMESRGQAPSQSPLGAWTSSSGGIQSMPFRPRTPGAAVEEPGV